MTGIRHQLLNVVLCTGCPFITWTQARNRLRISPANFPGHTEVQSDYLLFSLRASILSLQKYERDLKKH